jgi:hypothetical protein
MHLSPHFKPALVYKGDRFTNHFRSLNPRDAYIANNNGGFTIAHEVNPVAHSGITYVGRHQSAFSTMGITAGGKSPNRGHTVIYRQNGTGRDTYIWLNNGGFAI